MPEFAKALHDCLVAAIPRTCSSEFQFVSNAIDILWEDHKTEIMEGDHYNDLGRFFSWLLQEGYFFNRIKSQAADISTAERWAVKHGDLIKAIMSAKVFMEETDVAYRCWKEQRNGQDGGGDQGGDGGTQGQEDVSFN